MASRITQHGLEVIRINDAPEVRHTQEPVETLRTPSGFELRHTQESVETLRTPTSFDLRHTHMVVEVLRAGVPPATRIFPVLQAGRSTDNGGGTRIFPI